MIDRSIEVWRAMMPVLAPKHVVTVGVVARTVVEALGASPWVHTALRHPSPNAMSRMSGMFDADDLLVRYPEVKRVAAEHPGWFETYSQNKVFFACHAASLLRHHVRPAT